MSVKSLGWKVLLSLCLFGLAACSGQKRFQGYIEGEYINLSSNYSGILEKLLISRGDLVNKGQLLFVLDQQPEAAELAQAQQQLAQAQKTLDDLEKGQRTTVLEAIVAQRQQAEANLKLSTATLQRYLNLYKQGAVSKEQVDQAQSDYQRDKNQVGQYAANLAEAQQGARENQIQAQSAAVAAAQSVVDKVTWELAQKTVRAPTSGRIFDTYYKVGEFVDVAQPVASLLAPENIYLIFYIPEPQRSELSIGQTVYFSCDACKGQFSAKINYISPEAEYTPPVIFSRESRMKLVYRIQARLPLPEAQKFYPGQPVDVYLH